MEHEPIDDADLMAADVAVTRYLTARLHDRVLVEDLRQESLLRLLEVRHRLSPESAVPYAMTVAKHLVVGHMRAAAVADRHRHRLVTDSVAPAPDEPHEQASRHEDELALRTALEALPEEERELLLAQMWSEAPTRRAWLQVVAAPQEGLPHGSHVFGRKREWTTSWRPGCRVVTAQCRLVLLAFPPPITAARWRFAPRTISSSARSVRTWHLR